MLKPSIYGVRTLSIMHGHPWAMHATINGCHREILDEGTKLILLHEQIFDQ